MRTTATAVNNMYETIAKQRQLHRQMRKQLYQQLHRQLHRDKGNADKTMTVNSRNLYWPDRFSVQALDKPRSPVPQDRFP